MLLGGAFVLGINARPALVSRAASWVGAAGALLVIIPLLLRARA